MKGLWSERDLINLFISKDHASINSLIKGIGDDCAVICEHDDTYWLVTTDMLVENIHFNLSWHPPFELGRKSVSVNFSDIAAMGGKPLFVLLSIAVPTNIDEKWIGDFARGIKSQVNSYGSILIGGDTVRSSTLTINVTVIGKISGYQPIYRDTARAGENVYVSGELGNSAAGLQIFQGNDVQKISQLVDIRPFTQRHLDPEPDIVLGGLLAESGMITSMQDLSDGLATDLAHICSKSSIGAEIDADKLPANESLKLVAEHLGVDPIQFQVSGGEDYHLVFTVKKGMDEELIKFLAQKEQGPITRVGVTKKGRGVFLNRSGTLEDITFGGFEHDSGNS